jgi:uncharacterized protein YndB with AHSA1/START domain
MSTAQASVEPFVISRVFNAPRKLVWQAFTEADRLKHWFGPKGFTPDVSKIDLRSGGTYHYRLAGPGGATMWGKWVFREIVPQQRIVMLSSFSDENAGTTRHPMAPTWPLVLHSVFAFEDAGEGKTRLTIEWAPYDASPEEIMTFEVGRPSMTQGWSGTFEQLEAYLGKPQA